MKIITANKGESVIRIIQSLIGGSAEYYRDSLSPSPPHPTSSFLVTNDQSLKSILINLLKYITMQLILNIAELI